MDSNQLAEALARAVEAAKPAAEYCLLAKQDHWWTVCMTKAEWSGWMQAIGSMVALFIAIWIPSHARKVKKRADSENASFVADLAIRFHSELLDSNEEYLRLALARVPLSSNEILRLDVAREVEAAIMGLRCLEFDQIKLIHEDSPRLGRDLADFRCELHRLQEFMKNLERMRGFDEFELKAHAPNIRARLENLIRLKDRIRSLTVRVS